jgi:hypothetical protein
MLLETQCELQQNSCFTRVSKIGLASIKLVDTHSTLSAATSYPVKRGTSPAEHVQQLAGPDELKKWNNGMAHVVKGYFPR